MTPADSGPRAGRWWIHDVALELWVEAEHDPTIIRLEGTLDESTANNVLAVVRELIDEGTRDVELRVSALRIASPGGVAALAELDRLVRRGGGRLTRAGDSLGDRTVGPSGVCARRGAAPVA
jgi:ABC-type transporter Mla MlaB component